MKRRIVLGIVFAFIIFYGNINTMNYVSASERAIDVARRYGYDLADRYQPAGSIISEINTGVILWQENPEVSWAPASMTKLMTILVAYDAMDQGKFALDTQVEVNEKYADIAGRYVLSNNNMKLGVSYSVSEMIDLIIVPSSAAATYMLSDLVEPDADKFVDLMNKKAKDIGMIHTTYYNSVGVPNDLLAPYQPTKTPVEKYNISTPEDYALLCSYFVTTYPEILEHTKNPSIIIKEGTPYEEKFDTYQISLEGAKYELKGTDGLKTGSSGEGGFNYSSTAKRGDTRLVEIVMGVSKWEDQIGEELRHQVGNAIMEEAFSKYEYKKILKKGTHTIGKKEIKLEEDFWDCVPKGEKPPLKLSKGKVSVDLKRSYLPGYHEPVASYEELTGLNKTGVKTKALTALVVVLILLVGATGSYLVYRQRRLEKVRSIKRRKKIIEKR